MARARAAAAADETKLQPTLDQMRQAEFAAPVEVLARFGFVSAAGIALTIYTGEVTGLVWAFVYLASQTLHYLFLAGCHGPERSWQIRISHIGYAATNIIFVALPLLLLTGDDIALIIAGAFGLSTLVVFLLWRKAPPRSLLPFDMAVHAVILGVVLWHYIPLVESRAGQVAMIVCALAEMTYFALALWDTTDVRHRLRDAVRREIEAEKLLVMGQLTSGIAHDFNNILTVIRGNLELHDEVHDPEDRRRLVGNAHAAALRASALVAQLTSFSRRAPLLPVPGDAPALVAEVATMAMRTLPPGITVEIEAPVHRMPLVVDADRLHAALLNLVINARDAIAERPQGFGRITIAVSQVQGGIGGDAPPVLDPGDYVRFSVTDDGPGMSEDQAARAFEPFFTTKPAGKGMGLGLASAKGFAEQSGGTMTLESRPGQTVVALYLPLVPPPD
jgi:signal transduction histidine kinase